LKEESDTQGSPKMPPVNFWSSVGGASFLHALVKELDGLGISASYRYLIEDETYRQARGAVRRTWLRWRMYVEYPLRIAFYCWFKRESCVHVVCTNPFYAPLIAIFCSQRKNQVVIHWVFDLFPDALVRNGIVANGSVGAKLVEWVVKCSLRKCSANVFLGRRLLEHVLQRFKTVQHSEVIPIGADDAVLDSGVPKHCKPGDPISFIYCGNLGVMHDREAIVDAVRILARKFPCDIGQGENPAFTLAFYVSGSYVSSLRSNLEQELGRLPGWLLISGSLSKPDWVERMKSAQVGIVSIGEGAENVVMPSKTYSALAAGQAIVAVCPVASDLSDLVDEHDCGWRVPAGDPDGLAERILAIVSDPEELNEKRFNAYNVGKELYSMDSIARRMRKLICSSLERVERSDQVSL
jgi:glycosyltransferase involved in cell wall biosynthesis